MYVFNPSINHCIINYDTGGTSRSTWIEACQRARVDPHHLISQRTDELIQLVLEKVDMTKNVCRTFCVYSKFLYVSSWAHLWTQAFGLSQL